MAPGNYGQQQMQPQQMQQMQQMQPQQMQQMQPQHMQQQGNGQPMQPGQPQGYGQQPGQQQYGQLGDGFGAPSNFPFWITLRRVDLLGRAGTAIWGARRP
ncbi:hypothetical protein TeGR_g1071 [Tetraparma gracilis]|uniref:Uncharacterized protein n=1 Tax=Tetraparma gracilis TaxID=2962635 RepID=A0ABQ6M5A1_9STRA|nr:hypothetical protein TeGR_g1071 [Tetraparma gracilis]